MKLKRNLKYLFVCVLTTCTFTVFANTVGTVKSVNGEVVIKRSGGVLTPKLGTKVHANDELVTSKESSVGVIMQDNTVLTAGEESVLNIESFSFNRKSRRGRLVANVRQGSLSAISGHLASTSPDDVRFKTATMTLGVRGTEFVIEVPKKQDDDTTVTLLPDFGGGAGAIEVQSSTGESSVIDEAYTQAEISRDGSVTTSLMDMLTVIGRFCGLIHAQPPRPKTYLFYLDNNNQLSENSEQMLVALLSDIKRFEAAELDIAGYTDTSNSESDSDAISEVNANRVRDIIFQQLESRVPVSVVGRGYRDLLVDTAMDVIESKNNRVEVVLK